MNTPDKIKQLEVKFRLAWTHGTLPDLIRVAAIILACAGGGVWLGWDRIAQVFSIAPVAAFIALIGMTCFTSHNAAYAAVSPEATMAVFCLACDYGWTGKDFQ